VTLSTNSAANLNGQAGSAANLGAGFMNIKSVIGNNRSTSLVGPGNTNNYWNITGLNEGSLGQAPNQTGNLAFSLMPNLTGGAMADTFMFQQVGSVSGIVDGRGGTNTLDYSHYTGNITVDLALNLASLVNQGAANSVLNIANVTGSIGNDLIVGGASSGVLIGGTGENIIIADKGADTITGGGGDNILIGGYTSYDQNLAALEAIFAEWTSGDPLSTRIDDIAGRATRGLDLNGSYVLVPTATGTRAATVFNNAAVDLLFDGTGLSWFFVHHPNDRINNGLGPLVGGDRVAVIHP
jgi:Ca2+-binding RTX toxin-like protein